MLPFKTNICFNYEHIPGW